MPIIFISDAPPFFNLEPNDFRTSYQTSYQQPMKGSRDFHRRATSMNRTLGIMDNC